MKKYYLMICIGMIMSPLYAEIYKWVDSTGDVHFSDKPHPGAEAIILPKTQTYSSSSPPAASSTTSAQGTEDNTAAFVYKKVTIVQPEDQTTIRNTDGSVSVIVTLEPMLRPVDKLQVIFDGSPIGKPKGTTEFTLRGINRGSHTLAIQVLNGKRVVMNTSDTITIFMMQPRVNMGKPSP